MTVSRYVQSRVTSFLVFICFIAGLPILYNATAGDSESNKIQAQTEATGAESRDRGPCPDVRRPLSDTVRTDGRWQVQDSGDDKLVVYSAFYDDRPAVGVAPWIRVLAVARLASRTHYCHVWYTEHDQPYVSSVVVSVIGRSNGYVINKVRYVQYLLSCRLAGAEPVPSHVSIVADRCVQSTIYLPVERPVRAEPDIEFGVCVAIAFGHIATPVFVEWMELTWMLGVREFNVYDGAMVNMSDVFDFYTRRGWLKVHQMPPPVPVETSMRPPVNHTNFLQRSVAAEMDAVKLASPASLNDCMMRNVYRYRYVVVIDFDEVIIPRSHDNYTQLIRHLNLKYQPRDRPHTFLFHNTYFFLDLTPDVQQPTHMRTASFRRHTPPSTANVAPKSFVDPRTCLAIFNHYCLVSLLPSTTSRRRLSVSPDVARSHHYRLCGFKPDDCLTLFRQTTVDNIMLTFKSRLQSAIAATMVELNTSTWHSSTTTSTHA